MSATRVFGAGPQAALALHCSLAHSGEWAGLGAALGDLLTITAVDLPGHGTAADLVPGQDIGVEALRLAEAALPEGRVDLIGHSFGAVVALWLAMTHPARVRRLVLIEPTLFAAAKGDAGFAGFLAFDAPYEAALARGDKAGAARLFTEGWGGDVPWDAVPERQRRYITERIDLIAAAAPLLMDDAQGLLAPGRLEALDLPVLLMEGAASPPVINAIAGALATRLPEVRRVAVPGARHMLPLTHAAEVAAAVRAFLSPG